MKKLGIVLLVILLIFVSAYLYLYFSTNSAGSELRTENQNLSRIDSLRLAGDTSLKRKIKETDFTSDSNTNVIHSSEAVSGEAAYVIDDKAGKIYKMVYSGRRINIAVTGVDSRLGDGYRHADANHVISILLDSGKIEITSIPRDTYVDLGYPDSTNQNKLTVARPALGRQRYLTELAKIAQLDKIHYYTEFGFSQAVGMLNWLGFKNANATLQVLRSRKALGGDDYQRTYNQGQFIRQMLLKNFGLVAGLSGNLIIPGALSILETNLTTDKTREILGELKKNGFGSPEDITVKVRPPMGMQYKMYDFADPETIAALESKVQAYYEKHEAGEYNDMQQRIENTISRAVHKSVADSAKNPANVIRNLTNLYNQRAWLQLKDEGKRDYYRKEFRALLPQAYKKKGKTDEAKRVEYEIDSEIKLFEAKKTLQ